MWWCIKQLKLLRQVWRWQGSERAWALGLALGVLAGLIPKGNLTAVLALALLFSLRTHIAVGLVAATVTSLVAPWLDPLTHAIGSLVLGAPALEAFWVRLHQLPLVPWLRWNNTVVMGSLLLGSASVAPVYYAVRAGLAKWERRNQRPVALLPAPSSQHEQLELDTILVLPSLQSTERSHLARSPWRGSDAA